jgi:hypothetical protein
MGQLGFFDLGRRYESLDVKDDPLVAIAAMVVWESLRPKLKASLITGGLRASDVARKSPAARKPWDEVVIDAKHRHLHDLPLQLSFRRTHNAGMRGGPFHKTSPGWRAPQSRQSLPAGRNLVSG